MASSSLVSASALAVFKSWRSLSKRLLSSSIVSSMIDKELINKKKDLFKARITGDSMLEAGDLKEDCEDITELGGLVDLDHLGEDLVKVS